MSLIYIERAADLGEAVAETQASIVYHWAPWADEPSPLLDFLEDMAELHPEVNFIYVDKNFAIPPLTYDDLPVAVLYWDGVEVERRSINWMERGLIGTVDIFAFVREIYFRNLRQKHPQGDPEELRHQADTCLMPP